MITVSQATLLTRSANDDNSDAAFKMHCRTISALIRSTCNAGIQTTQYFIKNKEVRHRVTDVLIKQGFSVSTDTQNWTHVYWPGR